MNYYALTIRKSTLSKTLKQASQCLRDLEFFMKQLKITRPDVDVRMHYECVEHEAGDNIHLHAMVSSPQKVSKADIKISKGYHVDFQACRSRLAWNCYITKQDDTPVAILLRIQQAAGVGSLQGSPRIKEKQYLFSDDYIHYGIKPDTFLKKLRGI